MTALRTEIHANAQVDICGGRGEIVRLTGVIRDANVEGWFAPLISTIHTRAITTPLREVVLDIRDLEYANAAFWRCMVRWLKRIQSTSPAPYRLRVLCNLRRTWQAVALPTLRVFGVDVSGIEHIVLEEAS